MQGLAVFALLTVASLTNATQEIHLSGITLQLPQAWTVKTDNQFVVMASLAGTFDPKVLPWVTVTLCDADSATHPCPKGKLDLSQDKNCPGIQNSLKEWPHGITETRWVCTEPLEERGQPRGSGSITMFEFGKKKLVVYYVATDDDTPPAQFLDDFASGLRPE